MAQDGFPVIGWAELIAGIVLAKLTRRLWLVTHPALGTEVQAEWLGKQILRW